MKSSTASTYPNPFIILLILISSLLWQACDMLETAPEQERVLVDEFTPRTPPVSTKHSKLRHPQLLANAQVKTRADIPGKNGTDEVHLFLAFNTYEADGITRRVLDKYGITRRVLDKYGDQIRIKVSIDRAVEGITIALNSAIFDTFMADFENDSDFLYAEPDALFDMGSLVSYNQDPNNNQMKSWGIDRLAASSDNFMDSDVHVYVLDSGISSDDVHLIERKDFTMLFTNRDQDYIDEADILATPYFDPGSDGNPEDESGHGTHVAGTIGAIDNTTGVIGVAPGVKLHSLKVLTAEGRTDITTLLAAIDYVVHEKLASPNRPMAMNMSLGMDIGDTAYNVLDNAVQQAISSGIVVVLSAGNAGQNVATYSPAHVEQAITVGAYDVNNLFSTYSNHGPLVDILAPGDQIISLTHLPEEAARHENIMASGTSFAAPHVTGTVARFLAQNQNASPAQVRAALLESSVYAVKNAPVGTTGKTPMLTTLEQLNVPPFFQYAILSNGILGISRDLYVGVEGDAPINANIFTNSDLYLNSSTAIIEGFAYYNGTANVPNALNQAIQPRYNPGNLPAYKQADPVAVPDFSVNDFKHLAAESSTSNLYLQGHYELGTKENPKIFYVKSKIITQGPVTFSGYGIFLAGKGIDIQHNVSAVDYGETSLAFYTDQNILVRNNLEVAAQLFAKEDVNLGGNSTLYGNITAGGVVKMAGALDVYYRPTIPELTEPFWPSNGNSTNPRN